MFLGYRMKSGWTIQGALGAVLGGELTGEQAPGTFDLGTGFVASLTGARRWSLGDGSWFVSGSLAIGVARSPTEPEAGGERNALLGTDARIGVAAGKTFAGRVSPYVLARAFGGPVMWTIAGEDVTGSDKSHVQLGAGLNVALPARVSLIVDGSALGERSVSIAVSYQL